MREWVTDNGGTVKMEPNNARARLELARFYLRNNQPELAREELQVAYQLDPDLLGLATDLQKLGYQPTLADRNLDTGRHIPDDDR